jgi:hypothetical protein
VLSKLGGGIPVCRSRLRAPRRRYDAEERSAPSDNAGRRRPLPSDLPTGVCSAHELTTQETRASSAGTQQPIDDVQRVARAVRAEAADLRSLSPELRKPRRAMLPNFRIDHGRP